MKPVTCYNKTKAVWHYHANMQKIFSKAEIETNVDLCLSEADICHTSQPFSNNGKQ